MKILLIHTYYQLRGGEDAIFEQECELLRKDNEVHTLVFHNKGGLKGAFEFFLSIWNWSSAKKVKKIISEVKPDLVHIQNWHFASGPIIIRSVKKLGIPVVLTLHNFRLLCPSSTLLLDGKVFLDSLKVDFPWLAVKHKVYRNSMLQTFWLSFIVWFHKKIGTFKNVDRYILAMTDFAKNFYVESTLKLSELQIVIKPNFVEVKQPLNQERGINFLFIGRLMEEKGIRILLEAFKQTPHKLVIAGDGLLKNEVTQACKEFPNITYIGNLKKDEVIQEMQRCTALIFPSIWYEGMPMTILEAFAVGTPVIGSKLGAMEHMIQNNVNGLHFEPGNSVALLNKINEWQQMSTLKKQSFYDEALLSYKRLYTPEKNRQMLLKIYDDVLKMNKLEEFS